MGCGEATTSCGELRSCASACPCSCGESRWSASACPSPCAACLWSCASACRCSCGGRAWSSFADPSSFASGCPWSSASGCPWSSASGLPCSSGASLSSSACARRLTPCALRPSCACGWPRPSVLRSCAPRSCACVWRPPCERRSCASGRFRPSCEFRSPYGAWSSPFLWSVFWCRSPLRHPSLLRTCNLLLLRISVSAVLRQRSKQTAVFLPFHEDTSDEVTSGHHARSADQCVTDAVPHRLSFTSLAVLSQRAFARVRVVANSDDDTRFGQTVHECGHPCTHCHSF